MMGIANFFVSGRDAGTQMKTSSLHGPQIFSGWGKRKIGVLDWIAVWLPHVPGRENKVCLKSSVDRLIE